MRPIRRHLTYSNVMVTILAFIVLTGGTAVALTGSNTVFSDDIVNNQVRSADVRDDTLSGPGGLRAVDLAPSSVGASEVANRSLNDEDIAQGTVVDFEGAIGDVPANTCVERRVTGVNARGDHLLLTPNFNTAVGKLIYSAEYHNGKEGMEIQVCNPTNAAINDGVTNFNLLVIDAQ
jgi:hypothetical protein